MSTATNPLASIRILDLTRLIPGAVCTMMLADMGADVIKVEAPGDAPAGGDYSRWYPPQIDGQSVFFRMNNRNKRSMILDLKTDEGVDVLKRMVERADVLVESYRPDVMKRLGVDYETLKAINPKLVYCAMSGWGADGPYATRSGHDLNYVSIAGLPGAMETPQVLGGQMGDIGGAYVAALGIVSALFRRTTTGEGAFIDTSLSESALPFILYNWVEAMALGVKGGQGVLTGGLACYRVYKSREGKTVALAALENKFWVNFCNAVERPDLIENYQQPARQPYLIKELQELFALKNADEWDILLSTADCCFSVVHAPDTVQNDPHFRVRGALGTFDDGTAWMRSPVRMTGNDPLVENNAPAYGEHTHEILRESGFSEVEIERLGEMRIIKTP